QIGSAIQKSLETGVPLHDLIFQTSAKPTRKTMPPQDALKWTGKFVTLMKKGKVSAGKEGENPKEKKKEKEGKEEDLVSVD
ncbi:hypothetical protein, partial [Pseudomonas sp. Kh14]|uniref:hypothetical protein n=1 Tax=Pseudomonas sp. Kh14 TaxID=2093745 RepID=UPI0015B6EDD7